MRRSAVLLHDFCSVIVDEVTQLIRRLPPKSSLLNCMPITSQVVKGRDGAAGEPLQLQESFRLAAMATCQTANSLYKVGMLDFKAKHSLLLHSIRYGILKSLGYHLRVDTFNCFDRTPACVCRAFTFMRTFRPVLANLA